MMDDTAAAEVEETEAPEDTATSTEDTTEETEKAEKPEEAEKKPRRNRRTESRRIAQLTAQVRERERELERLQQQMNQPKQETSGAPKREDFDDYEEYIEAKADYRATQAAEKRLSEAETQRQERESQAQEHHQQQTFEQAREATIDRGAEQYPDFEEVTSADDLSITPLMAEVILSSDKGHELWYHLGKHPEVADKISGMSPVRQAAELGKIEASLTVGKQASNAPAPTKSPAQRGASGNTLTDKLSIDEWMKRRQAEVRR